MSERDFDDNLNLSTMGGVDVVSNWIVSDNPAPRIVNGPLSFDAGALEPRHEGVGNVRYISRNVTPVLENRHDG